MNAVMRKRRVRAAELAKVRVPVYFAELAVQRALAEPEDARAELLALSGQT
jgi:hypothetical protein